MKQQEWSFPNQGCLQAIRISVASCDSNEHACNPEDSRGVDAFGSIVPSMSPCLEGFITNQPLSCSLFSDRNRLFVYICIIWCINPDHCSRYQFSFSWSSDNIWGHDGIGQHTSLLHKECPSHVFDKLKVSSGFSFENRVGDLLLSPCIGK